MMKTALQAVLQRTLLSSSVSSYFDLESVPPSQGWESRTACPLVVPVWNRRHQNRKGVLYCLKAQHLARSRS